jgi:signal transduction histidine kinase
MKRLQQLSLKTRVSAGATLLLLLVLVLAVLSLTGLEKRSLIREIDSSLDDRIGGLVDDAASGNVTTEVPLTGRETGVVQILDSNNAVIASTPTLTGSAVLNLFVPRSSRPVHRTASLDLDNGAAEPWRIAAQRVAVDSSYVYIYAATNLDSVDHTIARLRLTLLLGIPLVVVAFGAISWLTARSSLAPVDRLSASVERMDNLDSLHQLPEVGGHDELARLVRTMNGLLTRAAAARRRERRFAADASHELRTPITTARLVLEIAVANPTQANLMESVNDTLVEIGRLEILARDLLEITRLDADRIRKTAIDVDATELLKTEVATRQRMHPEIVYRLTSSEETIVRAVPSLVIRVVRNILDNAERHTKSDIEVAVLGGRDQIIISVHNNGEPIALEDRVRIFDPFTRLDAARNRDDGGTGLGLAIAADIVEAHGGNIAVADDQRDGATFRFTLPASSGSVADS